MPRHTHRVILSPRPDGVWLKCECRWEHKLGFLCTPYESHRLAREHRAFAISRDKKTADRKRKVSHE